MILESGSHTKAFFYNWFRSCIAFLIEQVKLNITAWPENCVGIILVCKPTRKKHYASVFGSLEIEKQKFWRRMSHSVFIGERDHEFCGRTESIHLTWFEWIWKNKLRILMSFTSDSSQKVQYPGTIFMYFYKILCVLATVDKYLVQLFVGEIILKNSDDEQRAYYLLLTLCVYMTSAGRVL